MNKDEALELALELAEDARRWGESNLARKAIQTITAIKEALAQPDYRAVKTYHEGKPVYVSQPEQGPVAWEQFYPDIGKPQLGQEPVAIYRAGQAKGEGFHVEFLKEMGDDEVLLYTAPPKRPWVGLTDEPTYTEQQIANACWATEISDSKCESLLIALQEAAYGIKELNI